MLADYFNPSSRRLSNDFSIGTIFGTIPLTPSYQISYQALTHRTVDFLREIPRPAMLFGVFSDSALGQTVISGYLYIGKLACAELALDLIPVRARFSSSFLGHSGLNPL